MKFKISKLISTFFYTGMSRVCPGTVGSIATLPLWFLIMWFLSNFKFTSNSKVGFFATFLIIITSIYIIAYYNIKIYIKDNKKEDPNEVVIDEVIGQLLSFSLTLFIFVLLGNLLERKNIIEFFISKNVLFSAFMFFVVPIITFRIYDIKKPWIIGKIDKNLKGANGIILDDVFAGIIAGITNGIIILIIIKFL